MPGGLQCFPCPAGGEFVMPGMRIDHNPPVEKGRCG